MLWCDMDSDLRATDDAPNFRRRNPNRGPGVPVNMAGMKMLAVLCLAAVSVQGPLVSCSLFRSGGAQSLTEKEQFFVSEVKPILERNCLRCHNGTVLPGKLDLRRRDLVAPGCLKPGQPEASLLVTAVSRKGTHPMLMPQLPVSLTDDQIGVLREWIEDGAVWPTGAAGTLKAVANPENP